jgi:hypothetical protein
MPKAVRNRLRAGVGAAAGHTSRSALIRTGWARYLKVKQLIVNYAHFMSAIRLLPTLGLVIFSGLSISSLSALAAADSNQLPSQGLPAAAAQTDKSTSPVQADNLETSLRELHESLRRMKGDVDDILREVTRTEQSFNNGVPVSSNPWSQSPNYMINGGMAAQDALSHTVYLPPRLHWLNNSLAQMLDLKSKLQVETGNITKILASPDCNSATRSQGFVLSDITAELGRDIDGLEAVIRVDQPSNAKINVNAHKIGETISGMDRVGERLWKEAPRGLKSKLE